MDPPWVRPEWPRQGASVRIDLLEARMEQGCLFCPAEQPVRVSGKDLGQIIDVIIEITGAHVGISVVFPNTVIDVGGGVAR